MRIVINGFGRIGRTVLRQILALPEKEDIAIVRINDIAPLETCTYLFKYDSVYGPYPGLVEAGAQSLTIDGQEVELDGDDIAVRLEANEGWAAAQGKSAVVVLSTELTPELIRKGQARDAVRLVQDRRKELDLEFTDRIHLYLWTDSEELTQALEENREYICRETLATEMQIGVGDPPEGTEVVERQIGDQTLRIGIVVAQSATMS